MFFDSRSVARQINDCRRRAQAIVSGLSPKQLCARPQPDKWSIAECLAHLNTTASVVRGLMTEAIQRGRREKMFGRGRFSIGLRGWLLIWIAEPPPKFWIPAPAVIRPPAKIDDPLQVVSAFLKAQDEWERLMREQEGLDLGRVTFGTPTSAFYGNLAAALPWMMAHQSRHLLQAENVKRRMYPASNASARPA
jgi:DinB family protein